MKKSTKLMALLAVLCLVTSSFVGSTLAKYVTSAEGSDSARVAKFGVEITATGENFQKSYTNNSGEVTVESSTEDKVVAPGTSGQLATIELSGTPEVSVELKINTTYDLGDKWVDADDNFYCPLMFTFTNPDNIWNVLFGEIPTVHGIEYDNAEDLEAALNAASIYTAQFAPNTDLSGKAQMYIPTWHWAFETGDDEAEKAANNVKDTYLGDQAAADNAATISITTTASVTQID